MSTWSRVRGYGLEGGLLRKHAGGTTQGERNWATRTPQGKEHMNSINPTSGEGRASMMPFCPSLLLQCLSLVPPPCRKQDGAPLNSLYGCSCYTFFTRCEQAVLSMLTQTPCASSCLIFCNSVISQVKFFPGLKTFSKMTSN
jgi:hypothetical protein